MTRKGLRGGLAARSACDDAECSQRQHHDRARDQAPATGDGKADRKCQEINPLRYHAPHPHRPMRSFAQRDTPRYIMLNQGLIFQ
jgi:hypothetical protein